MELRAKSVRDVAGQGDGERLLISSFRPLDFPLDDVDAWERRLAPSTKLTFALRNRWITWREFSGLYVADLWRQAPALRELGERARQHPVTLLCTCRDERQCHRVLLQRMVRRMFREEPRSRTTAVALH